MPVCRSVSPVSRATAYSWHAFVRPPLVEILDVAHAQVEGIRLTAESSKRQLEAQMASIKHDAAQAAAKQRASEATWQAQIDSHRSEVGLGTTCHHSSSWLSRAAAQGTNAPRAASDIRFTSMQASHAKQELQRFEAERNCAREEVRRCGWNTVHESQIAACDVHYCCCAYP